MQTHLTQPTRNMAWGKKVLLGLAVFLGTLAFIGEVTNPDPTPPSYSTSDGYPAHSITADGFRHTVIGDSLTDVKTYLGTPESAQQHTYGNGAGGTSSSSCIYYNDLAGNTGVYQFCFDNGTLTSKARY